MPFRSQKQRRWMYANHPEMAKEWAKHTPDLLELPEDVDEQKQAAYGTQALKSMVRHLNRPTTSIMRSRVLGNTTEAISPLKSTGSYRRPSIDAIPVKTTTQDQLFNSPKVRSLPDLDLLRRPLSAPSRLLKRGLRYRQAAGRGKILANTQREMIDADKYFRHGQITPFDMQRYNEMLRNAKALQSQARGRDLKALGYGAAAAAPIAGGVGLAANKLHQLSQQRQKRQDLLPQRTLALQKNSEQKLAWVRVLTSPPQTTAGRAIQTKWALAKAFGRLDTAAKAPTTPLPPQPPKVPTAPQPPKVPQVPAASASLKPVASPNTTNAPQSGINRLPSSTQLSN